MNQRRLAYVRTFCGDGAKPHPEAEKVLADLRRFCGIDRGGIVVSPVSRMVDPHATAYRAGQRDVYLRIIKFLGLSEAIEYTEEKLHDRPDTAATD